MSTLSFDSSIQELNLSPKTLYYLDAGTIFCIQDIYFAHLRYTREKFGINSGLWNCHKQFSPSHFTELQDALRKHGLPPLDNELMLTKYLELLSLSEEEKRNKLMTEVVKAMCRLNLPINLGKIDTFVCSCNMIWPE